MTKRTKFTDDEISRALAGRIDRRAAACIAEDAALRGLARNELRARDKKLYAKFARLDAACRAVIDDDRENGVLYAPCVDLVKAYRFVGFVENREPCAEQCDVLDKAWARLWDAFLALGVALSWDCGALREQYFVVGARPLVDKLDDAWVDISDEDYGATRATQRAERLRQNAAARRD